MKNSLVKRQVMKAQSKKHRKVKQVQLQEFQQKEGKHNIVEIHQTMCNTPLLLTKSKPYLSTFCE
jgi:hypothetical protein